MNARRTLSIFVFLAASAWFSTQAFGAIEHQNAGLDTKEKYEQLAKGGNGGGGHGRGRGRGGDDFRQRDFLRSDDDFHFDDGGHRHRNRGRDGGFDDFGFDDNGGRRERR